MKKPVNFIFIFFFLFALGFAGIINAQIPECSDTRLGKMLLKKPNEKTISVRAEKDGKQQAGSTNDSSDQILTMRSVSLKGDSILTLEFDMIDINHDCFYVLQLSKKNRILKRFHLDSNGKIDSAEFIAGKMDELEALKYQPDVDRFLKHFE